MLEPERREEATKNVLRHAYEADVYHDISVNAAKASLSLHAIEMQRYARVHAREALYWRLRLLGYTSMQALEAVL